MFHGQRMLIDPTQLSQWRAKLLYLNLVKYPQVENGLPCNGKIRKGKLYTFCTRQINEYMNVEFTHDIEFCHRPNGDRYLEIVSPRNVKDEKPDLPDFVNARYVLGELSMDEDAETYKLSIHHSEVLAIDAVIDPLHMSHEAINYYARLLTIIVLRKDVKYFNKGAQDYILYDDESDERLYLHFKFSTPVIPYPKKDGSVGFEIRGRALAAGYYGDVYLGLGTISPLGDGSFTLKSPRHVIKITKHQENNRRRNGSHEYNLVARTQHLRSKRPNIISTSNNKSLSCRVERLMPGETLVDFIDDERTGARGHLPTDKRLELSIALVRALKEQVHDNGVIHCDVKADNINVDLSTIGVFTLDFNLSKLTTEIHYKAKAGTLMYMAPEVLRDGTSNDATDTYAMGVVLGLLWGLQRQRLADPEKMLAFALEHRSDYLLCNIDYQLSSKHHQQFKKIFKKMTHPESEQRCSLDEAIDSLNRILLERKLEPLTEGEREEVSFANQLAVKVRSRLYQMKRNFHEEHITVAAVDHLMEEIQQGAAKLCDQPSAISEYLRALGIACLAGITTKLELTYKLRTILTRFSQQFATLEQAQHFGGSGNLLLDATLEKTYRKYKKAHLELDEIITLMAKIDKKISELIEPAIATMLCSGRPESAYISSTPGLARR